MINIVNPFEAKLLDKAQTHCCLQYGIDVDVKRQYKTVTVHA